jgi:hypothetical protein
MDKKSAEKNVDLNERVGSDGVKYYKCLHCGTVGNWKTFIKQRMCCLQARKIKEKNGDKIIRQKFV